MPATQITGVQRGQFPFTVDGLISGVYAFRVDGQTPTGTRTFSISGASNPPGNEQTKNRKLTLDSKHIARSCLCPPPPPPPSPCARGDHDFFLRSDNLTTFALVLIKYDQ